MPHLGRETLLDKGHIYIIDDDEAMLSLLEEFFVTMGYQVSKFRSATKAVESMKDLHPESISAVISDVNMPKMGGFDLLKWINQTSAVPVILISAFGSSELEKKALEHGAHSLINKPFSLAYLKVIVEDLTQKIV